ncbi:hypothetical protein [Sphingobacterium lactis]|uniref:Uncharacterized protein n=1 Tax=Sphingobacterium lactis TaxID=797291 RepID=A0A1H6BH34_9SPHI|nr:hypothetical protein [Sphingobacterium lactis]SEG59546.1 hypothetical protein SAMN05421877_11084 [Sphingobacterium lactis]
MVSKNILVDTTLIGTLQFYVYVFNTETGAIGFGMFINDGPKPIFYLLNGNGSRITLNFDDEQILWLCQQSTFSTDERRMLFKEFLAYATKMEKKAANLVFRDAKMNYLSESREIIRYKRMYVHFQNESLSSSKRSLITD